jgi:hypothetical protein
VYQLIGLNGWGDANTALMTTSIYSFFAFLLSVWQVVVLPVLAIATGEAGEYDFHLFTCDQKIGTFAIFIYGTVRLLLLRMSGWMVASLYRLFLAPETDTSLRRRIRLIEGNAKSLRLIIDLKKDFAAAVYFSEASFSSKLLSWGSQAILYTQNFGLMPYSKVYLGSCVQLYSLAETPQLPPHPRVWAHIRGRYWSAKIDDISL